MNELHLRADCLCSKWGFNDGDQPEWLLDWADDQPDPDVRQMVYDVEWRDVLRLLVRRHLLPALAEHHQVEVYDIETNHNPIRASMIDGREVDERHDDADDWAEYLSHTVVAVPLDVVIATIREVG